MLTSNSRNDIEDYINYIVNGVAKYAVAYLSVSLRNTGGNYEALLTFKLNGLMSFQNKKFKFQMLNKITDGTIATQTAIVLDLCVKIDSFLTELVNAENTSTIIIKGGNND